LLKQNQGVTDIVTIGIGMGGDDFFDSHRETLRPGSRLGGIAGLGAPFHAGGTSLSVAPEAVNPSF
jgi:hypothetical protein